MMPEEPSRLDGARLLRSPAKPKLLSTFSGVVAIMFEPKRSTPDAEWRVPCKAKSRTIATFLAISAFALAFNVPTQTLVSPALAGDVEAVFTPKCRIVLSREIATGDSDRLKAAYEAPAPSGAPMHDTMEAHGICLDSPGGSYAESLKIADYVFSNGIPTYVGPGARCYSACSIIWLAGTQWADGYFEWRKLHVRGELGFHAPHLRIDDGTYEKAEVLQAFQIGIQTIASLMDIPYAPDSTATYSGEIVPTALLPEMLKKGPEEFAVVTKLQDAVVWGISLDGVKTPALDEQQTYCNVCFNYQSHIHKRRLGGGICNSVRQPNSANPPRFAFSGFGAEGLFTCVVQAQYYQGAADGFRLQLVDTGETADLSDTDLSEHRPLWFGYHPETELTALAKN